jgi:hypothetical protein
MTEPDDDGRVTVPLFMLGSNIGVLLDSSIACQSISLARSEHADEAVVLMIEMNEEQKAAAKSLGFKTTPLIRGGGQE